MTYDRAVIKMDVEKLYQANRALIEMGSGLPQ
jgi:hypothetical protein